MKEAMAAHLRLMAILPIRTHQRRPANQTEHYWSRGKWKRERIRSMLKDGASYSEIKRALGCGVCMITDERRKMANGG